ncbi:MAG TPA: fumarylacetoacetate hydrolase family protein [Steroidobacteraceae bacterium]|nr:fumarylacetoacetate hydrolase family protein [Steroidobacteraceae bacterium]
MKLVNFSVAGRASFGVLTAEGIVDLRARLGVPASDLTEFIRAAGPIGPEALTRQLDAAIAGAPDHRLSAVRLLTPTGRTRYFCIGINYPERNEEYKDGTERPKYPSVFMRTHTSLVAHDEPIVRPRESEQLDYEGEIVVVIGQGGRRIAERDALAHVLGYTCGNEGSVRDWLRHAKFNVTPGKNFDRSGSIGPWLVTADEVGTGPLCVKTRVNGELRQQDTSDRMIFPLPFLIAYLSAFCTLEPGDVIFSGTPSGAGARFDPPRFLRPGDAVEVEVSGVGTLRNEVIDDAA